MSVVRTHAFKTVPSSLGVYNFGSIKDTLFCATGAVDTAPQWDGVIGDFYVVTETGYQCVATKDIGGSRYVGDVEMVSANVRLVAGEKWTLQIIGTDPAYGFRMVWSGEKRYGETPQGNYGRTGGCSTLGCVTLV